MTLWGIRMKLDYRGQFNEIVSAILQPPQVERRNGKPFRCADFFCGIGGFHVAARNLGLDVVWACDVDEYARYAYEQNFGLEPAGDILQLTPDDVPDHDILCAGFPCQPFSIIGRQQGFSDPRGALFFEVLRFIRAKRPPGIVLENVKQLATADKGRVLQRILDELEQLGYHPDFRVLNALDFGLPQKRERTIVIALQSVVPFEWPEGKVPMKPLKEILEPNPDQSCYVSTAIRNKRWQSHVPAISPSIWHENKAGNISSHPFSCALRAGASHNYLLVDGTRRLTARELLRLQGFPDSWKIVCSRSQTRKQAGNAVPVPVVQTVLEGMVQVLERTQATRAEAPAKRPA